MVYDSMGKMGTSVADWTFGIFGAMNKFPNFLQPMMIFPMNPFVSLVWHWHNCAVGVDENNHGLKSTNFPTYFLIITAPIAYASLFPSKINQNHCVNCQCVRGRPFSCNGKELRQIPVFELEFFEP
jgi:hypothetical protein